MSLSNPKDFYHTERGAIIRHSLIAAVLRHPSTSPEERRRMERVIEGARGISQKVVPGRTPKETVDSPSNLVAGKPPTPPKKSRKQEYRPGRRAGTLVGSPPTVGSGKKTLLGA
jgi:hypothetical protein